MSLLPILRYPDPRLHKVAKPVTDVDDRVRTLVDNMLDTMYEADGIGLAATQVDVHECVIVIDTSDTRDRPRVLINPVLLETSDRSGQVCEFEAEGLEAVCVQHEMDHLRGKVFVEYLSALKRDRIKTKMLKKTRDEAQRPE
jgi:peptide deformylase